MRAVEETSRQQVGEVTGSHSGSALMLFIKV